MVNTKIRWIRWHLIPVLLPGKSHGWRSLVGCSPWGREQSDMTEWLNFHSSLSCIGEGNGNPLQCSCLENPRDRGVWWAAVYGVTQSQTRLKWLSSSRSSSIFFAAEDEETWYSQQKQKLEPTVAQILNSLLPNSDSNWRKWGKPLDHSGMT